MSIWTQLFGPGTWGVSGNLIATALLAVPGAVIAWLGRHQAARRLAGLWDRHHGPRVVARHKQALREYEAEKQDGG